MTYLLCVYLVPGPGLVLGTHVLQLSHMETLARDGWLGSKCSHRTPMSRLTDEEMGNRVVPRATDCLFLLAALPWLLMCGPASPSGQGCNLIKCFGAGSPFPPITLLKTMHWLSDYGRECWEVLRRLPPRSVCTRHLWLSEFRFLSRTSLVSCAHYPPGSSALWVQLQGKGFIMSARRVSQRTYLIDMIQ